MQETNNGMVREDKNDKFNHRSYTTPQVDLRYAKHMKEGEKKHGRSNWKKGGYPLEEYIESMQRHIVLLELGDTTEDHAAALRFNSTGYMHEEYLNNQQHDK